MVSIGVMWPLTGDEGVVVCLSGKRARMALCVLLWASVGIPLCTAQVLS